MADSRLCVGGARGVALANFHRVNALATAKSNYQPGTLGTKRGREAEQNTIMQPFHHAGRRKE